jgi:2-(1,2-epoxy-1,2-dihydrophenyl)acetyl-CoA isomerase
MEHWQRVPYFSYASIQDAMGREKELFMQEPTVLIEQRPGYRIVALNRPHRLNAFSEAMHQELRRAIDEAEADPDCRALLLTGHGRAFCSGQDLNERLAEDGKTTVVGNALDTYYNPLIRKLRALPFPVVAAVNGIAAGAGANFALACDIVLAARSASFTQAFIRIGLMPDCGGTWFLPRLVGPARARALALTGEPLSAEKAEAWGLIWKAVDDGMLLEEAHRLCRHFAAAPAVALALTKRALDESWSNDLDAQLDLERESQREAAMSADFAEGVQAFLRKRPPVFMSQRV